MQNSEPGMNVPPPPLPTPPFSADEPQREWITCLWAVLGTAGVLLLLGFSIVHWRHPDLAPLIQKAAALSFLPLDDFRPEPTETTLYMGAAFASPFLLGLGYFFSRRWVYKVSAARTFSLYMGTTAITTVLFSALVYGCLIGFAESASNIFATNSALFSMRTPPFAAYRFIYPLVLFPALLYLFHVLSHVQSAAAARVGNVLVIVAGIALSALAGSQAFFGVRAFVYPAYSGDHYSAVLGSVVQVYHGAPLLVDGLRNHYGLYPHFLMPIFKCIGLSVSSFNSVMGLLIIATFLLLFGSLRLLVKNNILLLLGFASLVFFSALYGKMVISSDPYFQYYPLRTFFPALVFFLATLYLMRDKKKLYYPLHIACALAVLWNPETGLMIWVSWLGLLAYIELFGTDWKTAARNVLLHGLKASLCALVVALGYVLLIYVGYGRIPHLWLLFTTLIEYGGLGYYALPMPLLHPWNLLALTYLIGLLVGIRAMLQRAFSPRNAVVFFCAVFGVGTFSYYQMRSHSHNIVSIWKETFSSCRFLRTCAGHACRKARDNFQRHRIRPCVLGYCSLCWGPDSSGWTWWRDRS